jgi:antitoxin component of RelBE/YafQ-DinJ toxin-antitoxin module
MLHVRIDQSILAQLDKVAERMTQERPGLTVSRADVVRMALLQYIAQHEPSKRAGVK